MRNAAEVRARRWYRLRGWQILGENVWIGGNELDLVVRRGRALRFVEVKEKTGDGLGDPLVGVALPFVVPILAFDCSDLVAVGLPRLREQDQRSSVGGLRREAEIQEDEWLGIPVVHERQRVERNPRRDDQGLPHDVLRRSKETCGAFGPPPERVLTEGAVLFLHDASVQSGADASVAWAHPEARVPSHGEDVRTLR